MLPIRYELERRLDQAQDKRYVQEQDQIIPQKSPHTKCTGLPRIKDSPIIESTTQEKWTQVLSISSELKINHEQANIRFNVLLDKEMFSCPARPFQVENLQQSNSLSSFWGSKKRQNPSTASQNPVNLTDIFDYIIFKLSEDKTYCFLGTLPKHLERANKVIVEPPNDSWVLEPDFQRITRLEFREHFLKSKKGALDLERVLETGSKEERQNLITLICVDLEYLMLHKFGNYIVQKVIPLEVTIMSKATKVCREKFDQYSINEYSSRVMQCLVEESADFKAYSLHRFAARPDLWLKSIAALFVLSTCMKKASSVADFSFVKKTIFQNKQRFHSSKYMKRALVSLVESCPDAELPSLFHELDSEVHIKRYLEDKYMTYLMVAFMRRSFEPCVRIVGEAITAQLKDLLPCSYFKLLINKLLSVGSPLALAGINTALRRIPVLQVHSLSSGGDNATNFYYYVFMTLSTFDDKDIIGPREYLVFLWESKLATKADKKLGELINFAISHS